MVDAIRKNWQTLEKTAQFLYNYGVSQLFVDDEEPSLQVRLALPIRDSTNEQRWFSALLEWGAPLEAWDDPNVSEGEAPEATVAIYEAEGIGWLREVARCVIRSKDLHVKVHVEHL